ISLRRDPPPLRGAPSPTSFSTPLADRTFTLSGSAGDFRVNIDPILSLVPSNFPVKLPATLQSAYVKSIRLANVDALNTGLHLEKAPEVPLEIVLGNNPGAVVGTVLDERAQAVADASVVLLPDVRRRTDLYKTVTTDPFGRFQLERVPPADYKIFAWTDVDNG